MLLGRSDEQALRALPAVGRGARAAPGGPAGGRGRPLAARPRRGARAAAARARPRRARGSGGQRERYLRVRAGPRAARRTPPRGGRCCSCSTTCTGPTRTRCTLLRHLARLGARARGCSSCLCARQARADPGRRRRRSPTCGARARSSSVELQGLDDDAVAAVLARPPARPTASPRAAYRERSGGNPFFLDELLREAQESRRRARGPPPGVRDVIAPPARPPATAETAASAATWRPLCGLRVRRDARARPATDPWSTCSRRSTAAVAAGARGGDRPARAATRSPTPSSARRCSARCRRPAARACTCGSPTSSPRDHEAGDAGAGEVVRAPARRRGAGRRPSGMARLGARRRARGRRRRSPTPRPPATTRPRWPCAGAPGARARRGAARARAAPTTAPAGATRPRPRSPRPPSSRAPPATRPARPAPPSATAAWAWSSPPPTPLPYDLLEEALAARRTTTRRTLARGCSRGSRSSSTTRTRTGPGELSARAVERRAAPPATRRRSPPR